MALDKVAGVTCHEVDVVGVGVEAVVATNCQSRLVGVTEMRSVDGVGKVASQNSCGVPELKGDKSAFLVILCVNHRVKRSGLVNCLGFNLAELEEKDFLVGVRVGSIVPVISNGRTI